MGIYFLSSNYELDTEEKLQVIVATVDIPVDMEDRLANLINKGSIIDIKVLPIEQKGFLKLVLSKIRVSDMLDENGLSSGMTLFIPTRRNF